jgi:uncharacterized protein (TIGR00369 family)
MTAAEINTFLSQAFTGANRPVVETADATSATCRISFHPDQVRPGGTLSGPTMMALADTTAYALVLAAVGFKPLAVTTSLSINFMRKPAQADLLATATMMKLGKALAVMDVAIRSDGDERLVAHAVVTYSVPKREYLMDDTVDENSDPFVAFHEWESPEEDEAWKDL